MLQINIFKNRVATIFLFLKDFIKDNIVELLLIAGMIMISIGVFLLQLVIGFIVTGLLLLVLAFLIYKGGD